MRCACQKVPYFNVSDQWLFTRITTDLSQNFVKLTNRSQFVRLALSLASDLVYTSTGGLQGTCLSPFFVYPVHCRLPEYSWRMPDRLTSSLMILYRLDRLQNDDNRHYLQAITDFVQWCDDNFWNYIVGKTKEIIIAFRKNRPQPIPVVMNGVEVERWAHTSI